MRSARANPGIGGHRVPRGWRSVAFGIALMFLAQSLRRCLEVEAPAAAPTPAATAPTAQPPATVRAR